MDLLKTHNIRFCYNGTPVLHEVNLAIAQGSFLALIGPNGSGKTTLLRIFSRALKPETGEVFLQGKPLYAFSPLALAQQIAVIASEQYFEFPFPVAEVVAMGRFPFLGKLKSMTARDWSIVDETLRQTDVYHLRHRLISQISSGERQRVLMARALCQKPQILILDEPNAHLDIHHQMQVFELLRRLNQETNLTVIVVLHDLTAASAFCDKIALLHKGRLLCHGSPQEVITEERIFQAYGAKVCVFPSPQGGYPQIAF